jgi:hypothetical protein
MGSAPQPSAALGHPRWLEGATYGKQSAVTSGSHLGPIHLGLDVHRHTISVAILPDRESPRMAHDEPSFPLQRGPAVWQS